MTTATPVRPGLTLGSPVQSAKIARYRYLKSFQFSCNGFCHHLPLDQQGAPHAGMPHHHARSSQLSPAGDWRVWVIQAGRGWGKTLTGAHWIVEQALKYPGTDWAVVAPKFSDARDTCIEGSSGILAVVPEDRIASYNKSQHQIRFTNGSRIYAYGAEDPNVGPRGKNLAGAWTDEVGFWTYPEVWTEQLIPAVGRGKHAKTIPPRIVVTTTPRPTELMQLIVKRAETHPGHTIITRGATFENGTLSDSFKDEMHALYDDTRVGRQEIYGELLDQIEGALWSDELIIHPADPTSPARYAPLPEDYKRIVVAIDPAGTAKLTSDLTGMVVAGIDHEERYWVLADLSGRYTPDQWARVAIHAYESYAADCIVGEVNFGADMCKAVVHGVDKNVKFREVHASRGKAIRAEPIVGLYEQRRVIHTKVFKELEHQQTHWVPGVSRDSPDRVDALVWAITELTERKKRYVRSVSSG